MNRINPIESSALAKPAFLVAIEGIDGSGKSTLAKNVAHILRTMHAYEVVTTKEPGGTPLGARIRQLVSQERMHNVAAFLLFSADRAIHMKEVVEPALERGAIVIADRFYDSSYAYQGWGAGVDTGYIDAVTKPLLHGIVPDCIVYCAIAPEKAYARVRNRGEAITVFEQEKQEYYERVIAGYETLFENNSRVLRIDALLPEDVLASQVAGHIVKQYASKVQSGKNSNDYAPY